MAYYDRFDIVEAHYWWNVHHHTGQGSYEYIKQCKISTYFKPSPLSDGPASDNAIEIYDDLCNRAGCKVNHD